MPAFVSEVKTALPGFALSVIIAMAASFITDHYGGPTVLFALLLGMAFHFLSSDSRFAPGIARSARTVLRLGVALLGARITAEQVAALGWQSLVGVALAVVVTIIFGAFLAKMLGMKRRVGVLTGGAVAICGASAAAAVSAVLPRYPDQERDTAFAIVAVTSLSTIAMVLYPILAKLLGFDAVASGIFLGGTIHDVAQVVGAGYAVSVETGDTATIIKLWRVALLVPIVLTIAIMGRRLVPGDDSAGKAPLFPSFLIAFILLVAANSLGWVPKPVAATLSQASSWCILISISALGIKTSLQDIAKVGPRAALMMVSETIFIMLAVLALIYMSGHAGS